MSDRPNSSNSATSDRQSYRILILDSITGKRLSFVEGNTAPVDAIAWSPTESVFRLASRSSDYSINVWDLTTRSCLYTLKGCFQGDEWPTIGPIVWSPDGHQLASSSTEHTVNVWDFVSGRHMRIQHVDSPDYLEFVPIIPYYLHTYQDTYDVRDITTVRLSPVDIYTQPPHYGVNENGTWITYKNQNIVWLPPEYRPTVWARHETRSICGSWYR
ncbi:Vegetative incompatibility protein HET-E-1 [Penicillium subrubescens]|uniref:Vegetative incompatibility protein HET-E-1 n=2 Tax=Penicillium subrubescens TaxID=1316194 RepID=A0A1Q5ULJ2_9EURO|nr:Vegetative incompatibility protein HET-E-1 [Penicillium subrubescens]